MEKQKKKSSIAIALYIIAAIIFVYALFKVYTSYDYINQMVDYGSISYAENMKDIVDYYLMQCLPNLVYTTLIFSAAYIIEKVTALGDVATNHASEGKIIQSEGTSDYTIEELNELRNAATVTPVKTKKEETVKEEKKEEVKKVEAKKVESKKETAKEPKKTKKVEENKTTKKTEVKADAKKVEPSKDVKAETKKEKTVKEVKTEAKKVESAKEKA